MTAILKPESWGELGPAMRALANDKQRAFVRAYVTHPGGPGRLVDSYIVAGYGLPDSKRSSLTKNAHHLSREEKIISAIAEESRKALRVGHIEAVDALLAMVRDPTHKGHERAVSMLLDRADPVTTSHHIDVVHKTISPDEEAIEELRAARALGAARDRLIELFGENELPRLERLEAAKSAQAKLVTGKVIDNE